jgi:hypothetical protein
MNFLSVTNTAKSAGILLDCIPEIAIDKESRWQGAIEKMGIAPI